MFLIFIVWFHFDKITNTNMDQGSNQDNNQDKNNFIVLNNFLKNTVHHWQERRSHKISGKEIEMKNVLEFEYS